MADAAEHEPRAEELTSGSEIPISSEAPQVYRPLSPLAIIGFGIAAAFTGLILLDGAAAFASRSRVLLLVLTLLTPLAVALGAGMMGIRQPGRLWSLAGKGLFLLYAGPITLGGLIAFSSSAPWLLPAWILFAPLVAGGLCWIARNQIQASEGTLGGLDLTRWGLWLSFYFGLMYAVYYGATWMAVRQQATDRAEQWLELLKNGDMERAFVETFEPSMRPPTTPRLRREAIQLRFNDPAQLMSGLGRYSSFVQRDYVRMIQYAEDDLRYELQDFNWEKRGDSYEAVVRYKVSTSLGSFILRIGLVGQDNSSGGRSWWISQTTGMEGSIEHTPKGERMVAATSGAYAFLSTWADQVSKHNNNEAYLLTVPPKEREKQRAALEGSGLLPRSAALGPGVLAPEAPWLTAAEQEALLGRARFFAGDLFTIDDNVFWVASGNRPKIDQAKVDFFRPVRPANAGLQRLPLHMPGWIRGRDKVSFAFTMIFEFPYGAGDHDKYAVEGQVVVSAAAPGEMPTQGWYIEKINLLSAHDLANIAASGSGP
jgi:hypothetical protein